MSDIKGHRLLVHLGASQVRRRLKGRGYGVRHVQSAGRNESVVIHTATGTHLAQLMDLLVPYVDAPDPSGDPSAAESQ